MMNVLRKRLVLVMGMTMAFGTLCAQELNLAKAFAGAEKQTGVLLAEIKKDTSAMRKNQVSPRNVEHGKLTMVKSGDWTSGFFPAELWYFYEYSKDRKWLKLARAYTEKVKKEQFNTGTHDLGFMIYCPFGNGYKLTGDTAYRKVIIQSARSLSTRFNPVAGVIRSWDHHKAEWKYPVIIDNMMNLELLFEATKLSGDSSFYKIAVAHANTTLKNHFRADFSSFHVVDYDVVTGKVLARETAQGYSDSSSWARGQAWALYGYTLCYRETKDPAYLAQAKGIAKYILTNPSIPEDGIPYWDYNDPGIPNVSRDASAAAITASALYELDKYAPEAGFKAAAGKILTSLNKYYTNKPGENKGFILAHSTGHRPAKSEIDVPINYADYYYIEALLRSR